MSSSDAAFQESTEAIGTSSNTPSTTGSDVFQEESTPQFMFEDESGGKSLNVKKGEQAMNQKGNGRTQTASRNPSASNTSNTAKRPYTRAPYYNSNPRRPSKVGSFSSTETDNEGQRRKTTNQNYSAKESPLIQKFAKVDKVSQQLLNTEILSSEAREGLVRALFARVMVATRDRKFNPKSAARAIRYLVSASRNHADTQTMVDKYLNQTRFLRLWTEKSANVVSVADDVGLSIYIHSLGALGRYPGDAFMEKWVNRMVSLAKINHFQVVANTIWAFAKLGIFVPRMDFWMLWVRSLKAHITNATTQELSLIIYSFGRLEAFVDKPLAFGSQEDQQILSLANETTLRYLLMNDILAPWSMQFISKAPQFKPQELASVLWAFGKLGIKPSSAVLTSWMIEFNSRDRHFEAIELANVLFSYARIFMANKDLKSGFPESLLDSWEQRFHKISHTFSHQEMVNALWAFSRLCYMGLGSPSSLFLKTWEKLFEQHASSFSNQELAMTMWSFGRLAKHSVDPESVLIFPSYDMIEEWMCAFMDREELNDSKREDVANKLRRHEEFLDSSSSPSSLFVSSPQEISCIFWGLASLTLTPDDYVLERLFAKCDQCWHKFRSEELAALVWALGKLQLGRRIPLSFLKSWYSQYVGMMSEHEPQALANGIWGLARCNAVLTSDFIEPWFDRVSHVYMRATSQEMASMVWSLGKLYMQGKLIVPPSPSFIHAFNNYFLIRKSEFNRRELVNCAWGWATLGVLPNRDFPSFFRDEMQKFGPIESVEIASRIDRVALALSELTKNGGVRPTIPYPKPAAQSSSEEEDAENEPQDDSESDFDMFEDELKAENYRGM